MAISTIGVDANNDIYLYDGYNIEIVVGEKAVDQGLVQATKQRKKENPFDSDEGVGYFESVFCPQPQYDEFRFDLNQAAMTVPDTTAVQDVTISKEGDVLKYQMTVATVYGQSTIEVEIP